MLGFDDPQIWLAYVLCIAAAAFSVIYGLVNWNNGDEQIHSEDKRWIEGEKEVSEEL
jgi:hypothetical protein